MTIRLFFLFTALPFLLHAQPKALDSYFSELRAGKYPNIPAAVHNPDNALPYLEALTPYLKDTVTLIRAKAAGASYTIGVNSRVSTVRTKAVQQLINAARDPNTGNGGSALNFLTQFKKNDFTKASKDSLVNFIKRRPAHLDVAVKLAGFLELNQTTNDLYAISQDANLGRKERWSAMLALARMNDELAAQEVMSRVKRMPVGDAVVYQIFPDLAYTRRKEAIAFLLETLNSDAKNCESADAERANRIPCAYRVMEMLAPVIENYPLKLSEGGDIETTDYPAALQSVRNWLQEHPDFKISKDTY
jgi:hypothetical protein